MQLPSFLPSRPFLCHTHINLITPLLPHLPPSFPSPLAAAAAAPIRQSEGEEDPGALIPMLRDVSRQEYLRKREEAKLQELKDELEDAK